jgi:3-oxoacyl-[acyl-carrier-protein] synthase-3
MRYENVCLESIGYALPEEVVTSAEIEARLAPLYERLRLPEGRLELITGVQERRFWAPGTLPSQKSVISGGRAIEAAGMDPAQIGVLIHGSVCRDFLEPATASAVHHHLGLGQHCLAYDVSNACLGLLNGAIQVANMIELGQIKAGLVLGSEGSRQLVETTIAQLNANQTLTRDQIKTAIASLTIGSASCAMLFTHRSISRTGNRLSAAVARANTQHFELCHSGRDEAVGSGMQPLMETDSEQLMQAGIATGVETFESFLGETGWDLSQIDKTICHQVGLTHRKLMLQSLNIPIQRDFASVTKLGNTGSVALPITLALAAKSSHLRAGDRIGLFGIGSGIHCLMLALNWNVAAPVIGDPLPGITDQTTSPSALHLAAS